MRKSVTIGITTAALLGGAAAGVVIGTPALVGAQDDPPATAEPAPQDQARPEPGQWVRQALDDLVTEGVLTQEQAEAVITKLAETRPERDHGRRGPGRGHKGLGTAAEAIGVEPQDLMAALRDGKTLAQVAQDNGVDPQAVIDAMVGEAQGHLDDAVAAGKLTQEEADAKKAELTERITDLVNNGRPEGADSRFDRRGPKDAPPATDEAPEGN